VYADACGPSDAGSAGTPTAQIEATPAARINHRDVWLHAIRERVQKWLMNDPQARQTGFGRCANLALSRLKYPRRGSHRPHRLNSRPAALSAWAGRAFEFVVHALACHAPEFSIANAVQSIQLIGNCPD
jgi:hypothetical protein